MPATGLEPVRCYSLEPESSASANSATRATEIIMTEWGQTASSFGGSFLAGVRLEGVVPKGKAEEKLSRDGWGRVSFRMPAPLEIAAPKDGRDPPFTHYYDHHLRRA